MFRFFKKKKPPHSNQEEQRHQQEGSTKIASGYAASSAAQQATQQAAKQYAKPQYTGNRQVYDSGPAKINAKAAAFQANTPVTDPYTGAPLTLRKQDAKALYGNDWQNHHAEADHVKPLARSVQDANARPLSAWNTASDYQQAFNNPENIRVTSRTFNNAKRSRTNQELLEDTDYLQRKGIAPSEAGWNQAMRDDQLAERSINQHLFDSALSNMVRTGHDAGMMGAQNAGATALTMSGIMNVVSVIRGEKSSSEAISDTLKSGGTAAVSGYTLSGGLTIVQHSLSSTGSEFIQSLIDSNVPGTIVTSVIVTGDTLAKWGNGEISTQQCLIELGDKGVCMAAARYSMAAGQALIPIPVVGAAVGALVGTVLTSSYYRSIVNTLQTRELEHQERLRIIAECNAAAEQTRRFRAELESYLNSYFREYRTCFDTAINSINYAYQTGNANGVIAGANTISRKLGGKVHYETVDEFRNFLASDADDEW